MTTKKYFISSLLFIIFTLPSFCQVLGDKNQIQIGGGYGFGIGSPAVSNYNCFVSHGYKIDERFVIGLGLAYRNYSNIDWFYQPSSDQGEKPDGPYTPFGNFTSTSRVRVWTPYLHATYNMTSHAKINPFVTLKGGYGIVHNKLIEHPEDGRLKSKGGVFSSVGAGVFFDVFKPVKMYISADYSFQKLSHTISKYKLDSNASAIGANVGFVF